MLTSILRYYFWITVLLVAIIVGVIVWWFEYRYRSSNSRDNIATCESIIDKYNGNYLSHLMYSGDKKFS